MHGHITLRFHLFNMGVLAALLKRNLAGSRDVAEITAPTDQRRRTNADGPTPTDQRRQADTGRITVLSDGGAFATKGLCTGPFRA